MSNNKKKIINRKEIRKWFDMELEIIDISQVPKKQSLFGNSYFILTKEDVKALKRGRVLYDLDEYGTFIMLDPEYRKELRDKELLKEMAERGRENDEKFHDDVVSALDAMPAYTKKAILDRTQELIKDAIVSAADKDKDEVTNEPKN